MDKVNHDPIALPPGGFEHGGLEKALDKIAHGKPEKRDEAIAGLATDAERVDDVTNPGLMPGHRFETRDRVIVEGREEREPGSRKETVVGEVSVKETIQVFDPKKADEEIAAAEDATPAQAPEAAPAVTAKV